jgi:hypothetical protein
VYELGVGGVQSGLDQFDAAAAPEGSGCDCQGGDGYGAGDVEGDPGDPEAGSVAVCLDRAAEQGCRGAGVLQARAPWALGQLGGQEPVRAERGEEGVGHVRSLDAPIAVWCLLQKEVRSS